MAKKTIAKECLRLTGLYESELLTELMLRYWNHPLADQADFRSLLLETAAEVLHASIRGERLFADLEPPNVNFVAALWHAESLSLTAPTEVAPDELKLRQEWLERVLRAIPSCFCNPSDLT